MFYGQAAGIPAPGQNRFTSHGNNPEKWKFPHAGDSRKSLIALEKLNRSGWYFSSAIKQLFLFFSRDLFIHGKRDGWKTWQTPDAFLEGTSICHTSLSFSDRLLSFELRFYWTARSFATFILIIAIHSLLKAWQLLENFRKRLRNCPLVPPRFRYRFSCESLFRSFLIAFVCHYARFLCRLALSFESLPLFRPELYTLLPYSQFLSSHWFSF